MTTTAHAKHLPGTRTIKQNEKGILRKRYNQSLLAKSISKRSFMFFGGVSDWTNTKLGPSPECPYTSYCHSSISSSITTINSLNYTNLTERIAQLECGPMPNVMVALPNIGGALCSTPQSLADAHYYVHAEQ